MLAVLLAPSPATAHTPDPCFDPARPEPAYCVPGPEGILEAPDVAPLHYRLYAFYEWLPGVVRTPAYVLEAEAPYSRSAIRLYDTGDTPLLVLERNVGEVWIEAPHLARHAAYGTLLVVPVHTPGGSEDRLFRWRDGAWRSIDAGPRDRLTGKPGWLDAAEALLPEGWRILRPPALDATSLTAATPLWTPADRSCCPTAAGTIRFAIEADALTVRAVTIDRGADD